MDALNNPNLKPEIKVIILIYFFAYVLPEILNEMPEIYKEDNKLRAAWLVKKLHQNCE